MKKQIEGMTMKKVLALVVAAAMGLSSAAFAAETTTTPAPTATTTKAAPAKTTHHKNSIKQHLPRKRRRLKSIIKIRKLNRKPLNKKRRQRRNTPRNTAISNRQNLLHNPQRKFSTVMLARPLAPENYGAKRVTFSTAFSGG
ncbi:acid resistance repetitive basic protein Asr [Escherichia coli]|uniref:acid resistance repetitive basic protein Asr n=1 Tax=Escherichia coli TaxID=562 RepID=UPI00200A883C|nr:acid resistance repetitive basic protein Asr [Escherichia coli]